MIRRPHFKREPAVIEGTLRAVRMLAHHVSPMKNVNACHDPDDNMFLECAEAAHADYLVTGNRRHFPGQWKKTRVSSACES